MHCGTEVVVWVASEVAEKFCAEYLVKLEFVTIYKGNGDSTLALWPGNNGTRFVILPEKEILQKKFFSAIISSGDSWRYINKLNSQIHLPMLV